jgi:hypothetical protein
VTAVAIKFHGNILLPVFGIMTKNKPIINKLAGADKLPAEEKSTGAILCLNVDIKRYFEYIALESDYLKILLFKTILKIVHSGLRQDLSFGSIIEGNTFSGGAAEVTNNHCIRINSNRLRKYQENVAMALLAHELAHDHLKHFKKWKNNLENERKADSLAKEWGFDVDRFRKICGPPGINNRLLQIAIINKTFVHGMSPSL